MILRPDTPLIAPERRRHDLDPDGISIGQIFSTLWRRRWVLLSMTFAITALGFAVLSSLTPTYTSTAMLVLSAQQDAIVDMREPYMHQAASDAVVRSETDALRSRTLVDRIIDRENLIDDPEFNPFKRPFKPNLLTRTGFADVLPAVLQPYVRNRPLDPSRLSSAQLKYSVASQVLRAYQVTSDPKTYTVDIAFTSVDPEKASRITNAFVEEYMKSQIEERVAASDRAADWLGPRLDELSRKVVQTGRAVAEFRASNNIVDLPGMGVGNTLAAQEIQNLSQGLATARATRAQVEAAQQEVEILLRDPSQALSAPAVAAAPIVENLRVQEATAAAQLASLQGTYGERHPQVVSAASALNTLRERLAQEAARAVRQLDVQMRQAQSSEAELQLRMDQLAQTRSGESRLMPRLQQLESEAEAAKGVYDAFIQGLFRAGSQNGVPTAKGRIIQEAGIVAAPTFPNVPISMAVVFGAAILTAVGLSLMLEAGDKSFHSAGKLEDELNIPVLGMTLLSRNSAFRFIRRPSPLSRRVVMEPTSVLSESVRLAGTAIAKSRAGLPPQVVMVTSAAPAEGKTVFALMLARQSAQSGKRVIAIEAELRKPKFGRELYPLPQKGLSEYLSGNASLDEVVGVDNASGVHFIAVRARSRFASELLASREMASLIQELRAKYDLIVIDTPPASIVADALQLGGVIDTGVLVVKWGTTPKHLVADALHKLRVANVPLAGVVMTQVNPRRYRSYGEGALSYEYAREYYAA